MAASVIGFRGEINPIVNLPVKLELYQQNKYCYSTDSVCYQFYLYVLLLNFTGKVNLAVFYW